MSDENSKPSLKDRIKPHLPAVSVGVAAGVIITLVVRKPVVFTNITQVVDPMCDVWLSDAIQKQLTEKGSAMIQLQTTGQFIDLINTSHPKMLK